MTTRTTSRSPGRRVSRATSSRPPLARNWSSAIAEAPAGARPSSTGRSRHDCSGNAPPGRRPDRPRRSPPGSSEVVGWRPRTGQQGDRPAAGHQPPDGRGPSQPRVRQARDHVTDRTGPLRPGRTGCWCPTTTDPGKPGDDGAIAGGRPVVTTAGHAETSGDSRRADTPEPPGRAASTTPTSTWTDSRFWLLQVVVLALVPRPAGRAAWPSTSTSTSPAVEFTTVVLFLIPVVYAALNFGCAGALVTSLWVTVPGGPRDSSGTSTTRTPSAHGQSRCR